MNNNLISENTKTQTSQIDSTNKVISNPIYRDFHEEGRLVENDLDIQQRTLNILMFWGLAIVAVTLFYKALSSLML